MNGTLSNSKASSQQKKPSANKETTDHMGEDFCKKALILKNNLCNAEKSEFDNL